MKNSNPTLLSHRKYIVMYETMVFFYKKKYQMAKVMALNETVHDSRETSPHLKKKGKKEKKKKKKKKKKKYQMAKVRALNDTV